MTDLESIEARYSAALDARPAKGKWMSDAIPNGTSIFKWNDDQIPVSEILALTPHKPLYGHRSGRQSKTPLDRIPQRRRAR